MDETPSYNDVLYEGSKELGLWYGENEDGFADFFAWSGGQGNGYSGRHYPIETVDGEEITLKGPFSSRAGVINKVGENHSEYDWGPALDVRYKESRDQLTPRSGAVTLEAAERAVEEFLGEDVVLEEKIKFSNEEPYYVPQRTRGEQG